MDAGTAFELLKEEMGAHGLIDRGWSAQLDDAKQRFGICRMTSREISLSRTLIALNPEEEVRDTILHEIAHALAWEIHGENCGHDERWKAICRRIGARPERTYDDEVIQPDLPWVLYHTETGEIFTSYQRRPKRDTSRMWWRGRKEETLGKLAYGLNPALYPPGELARFDRNSAKQVQAEVLEALEKVATKWGLSLEQEEGRFGEASLVMAIRLTPSEGGDGCDDGSAEKGEFARLASSFGLKAEDYHRSFVHAGEIFSLVALKPRNRKYPVIGRNREGQRYKFPLSVLQTLA